MSLVRHGAVLARRHGLPRLVKSFEDEGIEAPGDEAAIRLRVKGGGGGHARYGVLVLATGRRPPRLARPQLDRVGRLGHLLDAGEGLHHVVEVGRCRVGQLLALPVGEAVAEPMGDGMSNWIRDGRNMPGQPRDYSQDVNAPGDHGVCSPVLVLVPAIRRSNFELRQGRLHVLDLV
jgi:hypothetical protein